MAVSVTLVFACEAHREAWLRRSRIFDDDEFAQAAWADYEARKDNTNLYFVAGPIEADGETPTSSQGGS